MVLIWYLSPQVWVVELELVVHQIVAEIAKQMGILTVGALSQDLSHSRAEKNGNSK